MLLLNRINDTPLTRSLTSAERRAALAAKRAWREHRRFRVAAHRLRVALEEPAGERRANEGHGTPAQPVWCEELRRSFPSRCAAARFAGVSPARITKAIRAGRPAAGYHWVEAAQVAAREASNDR